MPPNYGRPTSYGPGTPPMNRASPAMAPAMPQPNPAGAYYYQPPPMNGPMPQVNNPSPFSHTMDSTQHHKPGKRRGQRGRDVEKFSNGRHRSQSGDSNHTRESGKTKRYNKRLDPRFAWDASGHDTRQGQLPVERGERTDYQFQGDESSHYAYPIPQNLASPFVVPTDLSPASGNFERSLLTLKSQYPHFPPGQFDPRGQMPAPYGMGYPMPGQPHSPAPGFQAPYTGPSYQPAPQPMSRNPSQASEPRPASSTGQPQGSQGAMPQIPPQAGKPLVAASPQFARPAKKSAAITIRNANGEVVDFSGLKAPASPAPSSQSKTPPVVASTPPPPPKSSTPKAVNATHGRTDSTATKTQVEVQNEFKEKIAKQLAEQEKAKEDQKAAEEARVAAEAKAKEEEKLAAESKAEEEKKAAEEAEAKAKEEAKPEPAAPAAPAADAPADEEDEIERMIREMEEADARREAEQAEISKQKKAVADAKKVAEEEAKKAAGTDDKLKEAEREAERLEEEKERRRKEGDSKGPSVADLLSGKMSSMSLSEKGSGTSTPAEGASKPANLEMNDKPVSTPKPSPGDKRGTKPAPLNLNTKVGVEPPQPSAMLQSLTTARLLKGEELRGLNYPGGISSPNPALNAAVSKKGTSFKYDPSFLLQFKGVFTEVPSLEFSQQVKTLIGDGDGGRSASARTPATGGRQNSKAGAGNFPSMGSFGAGAIGGKTLPAGTTSEQRFMMSTGQMARPAMGSVASFGRSGGFPGGSMMSRTPSSSNMAPGSPRITSSRRTGSKRDGFNAKAEAQAAKTMPLTAGMKIDALHTSTTGWKPTSIAQKPSGPGAPGATGASTHLDPTMVQRKVKSALNKMTPENFEKISEQILEIAAQSKEESDGRTLRQVIQLTFEKATDEAHWASMYARFCKRMLETMSSEIRDENIKDKNGNVVSGGALFRKYLLNRCQEDFERGWKTQLPEPKEGESKEAALMSDEYYAAAAAKRRGLGLVQFIGELFKLQMLTERIMHECVRKLVDFSGTPDEAEVESLSKLLRTIGSNFDSTEKGRVMMDVYFQRIQTMMDHPDIPSRLQFMLMDVMDLRRANWVSKETNKGPKTLDEVRAEAEAAAAQKAAEAAKSNQRGGSGRPQMGRGDARQFSSGYPQQAPNQVGMDDLRRLKGSANRASSQNISLGPTSMFSSRSNSGRRLGPGGSLTRGNEDSAASSRTGTPPTRETHSSTNAFRLVPHEMYHVAPDI
jgi:translation initiation factor 4G